MPLDLAFWAPVMVGGLVAGSSSGLLSVYIVGMRIPFLGVCVAHAALAREPHTIARYLTDVAGDFHRYYNANRVLGDDRALARARLALAAGVATVVKNGLDLLGVSAPESM